MALLTRWVILWMLKCCGSSKKHQIFAEEKWIMAGKSWRALCWEQDVDSGEHRCLLALLLYSFIRNYIRTPLETGYWAFILAYWEHLFFCYCNWRRLGLHRRSVGLQSVLSYLSLASSVETEILAVCVCLWPSKHRLTQLTVILLIIYYKKKSV